MADYEVKIVISGDNASAVKAMQDTVDGLKKFNESANETKTQTKEVNNEFLGLVASTLSVGAVFAGIKDVFSDFAQDELATIELNSALKNLGIYTKETSDKMQEFSMTMMDMTGIQDDQIRELQAYGLNLGISKDKLDEATKGAIGLSTALRLDLNTSMKLTSAYLEGNVDKMTRILPILSSMKSDEEKLAFVQEKMNNGFKDAQEKMNGAYGATTNLKNQFGELKESIGQTVSLALIPIMNTLTGLIKMYLNLSPVMKEIINGMGLITAAFIAGSGAVKIFSSAMMLLNLNPIALGITAVVGAMVGLVALMSQLENQAHSVEAAFDDLKMVNKAYHDQQLLVLQLQNQIANTTDENTKRALQNELKRNQAHLQELELLKKQANEEIEIRKKKAGQEDAINSKSNINKLTKTKALTSGELAILKKQSEEEMKIKQMDFDWSQKIEQSKYETRKKYIGLGLQAGLDAAMAEGATAAKVLGAVLRAEAKALSESLILKSIAAFASFNPIGGAKYLLGSAAVLLAGEKAASAIENNPIKLFAEGGIINEPVFGIGQSGQRYMFGEAGPERVSPITNNNSSSHSISIGNVHVKANNTKELMQGLYEIQRRTSTRMMARA